MSTHRAFRNTPGCLLDTSLVCLLFRSCVLDKRNFSSTLFSARLRIFEFFIMDFLSQERRDWTLRSSRASESGLPSLCRVMESSRIFNDLNNKVLAFVNSVDVVAILKTAKRVDSGTNPGFLRDVAPMFVQSDANTHK